MKKLALILGVSLITMISKAQDSFDVETFKKVLVQEMESQFPEMKMDSSILYVASARSSQEAKNHSCYVMKEGGMVNTKNDESSEAKRLVEKYVSYLEDNLGFKMEELQDSHFKHFSVSVVPQYGGLVRYGVVIDSRFNPETLSFGDEETQGTIDISNVLTIE
jgi:hypothetical protein